MFNLIGIYIKEPLILQGFAKIFPTDCEKLKTYYKNPS